MAVNKVVMNTENGAQTLIDLTGDTITADKLAKGVTAHDKSGKSIVGTMSSNTKTYEITLSKAFGWILLTTLDDEVLAHINDESLLVSLTNTSTYETVDYAGEMYLVGNRYMGNYSSYDVYGVGHREGRSGNSFHVICAPANSTSSTLVYSSAFGQFRINGGKYYIQPGDGYIKTGTYKLTFTW